MARRNQFNNYPGLNANGVDAYSQEQANDDELGEIYSKVNVLKSLTLDMGEEIRSQNSLLNSMDNDFNSVWGKLSNSMSRVKNLAAAGHNSWLLFYLVFFALFVFLIIYLMVSYPG